MQRLLILIALVLTGVASCTHDPILITSPIVEDSTGNVIDTTEDGIDTTDNGTDTTGIPCDPDTAYFQDVLPVLLSNCAMSGCHDESGSADDIVLTSYESIMGTADVDPYDPGGSKLYKVLVEDETDDRMPPPPNEALPDDQIALIYNWILQGALNNSCGGDCDTSDVTFSATIWPILNTNCLGCHNGADGQGGIDLSNYGSIYALAMDGRLGGSVNGAAGYTQMPLGGSLSDCQILKINIWIADGAPNN